MGLTFTPARKHRIHNLYLVFGSKFPPKQQKKTFCDINILLELMSQKGHLHVFVCDSENYMENMFRSYVLRTSHFDVARRGRCTRTVPLTS